jgi:hydrogenase maturation protease HycI
MGMGSELRGDDAAGVMVVRRLKLGLGAVQGRRWLVLDAGAAPENFTGAVRRFKPDLLVLVDAAQLGREPGTTCWVPWRETGGLGAGTHTLPVHVLGDYLKAELQCELGLIGIQPAQNDLGAPLSRPVQRAVREIARVLGKHLTAVQQDGLSRI